MVVSVSESNQMDGVRLSPRIYVHCSLSSTVVLDVGLSLNFSLNG